MKSAGLSAIACLLLLVGNVRAANAPAARATRTFAFQEIQASTTGYVELDWEKGTLLLTGGATLITNEFVLTSEKLTIHFGPTGSEPLTEALAEGKVWLNGKQKSAKGELHVIEAKADRADYSRAKQLVVLVGNLAVAHLEEPALKRSYTWKARTININLKQKKLSAEQGAEITIMLPEEKAAAPGKP